MAKNDWQEAGDQFKKLIQDAVDSNDFSKLGSTLTGVVNDTVNGLQSVLQENLSKAQQTASGQARSAQQTARDRYQYTNSEAADRIRRNLQNKPAQTENAQSKRAPAVIKAPGEITGSVLKWGGYCMAVVFGLAAGILFIIGLAFGKWAMVPAWIMAFLFAVSFLMARLGVGKVNMAKRFRRYMAVLGDRTFCKIGELAAAVGQSSKFVKGDLKKMIGQGFFKEGYLDSQETTLITDRSTYQQYLSTQAWYEQRTQQESGASQASGSASGTGSAPDVSKMTPECREIIEEGQKYIQHIHACNERISGEEISAKLDRLELVVTRIFQETEKEPSVAGDLKKLMKYYLPTTTKLLDAYCDMEQQPVAGQNIETSKKEIENALDTINAAFANLLDSLFQDTAWDISSDITVLHTMLAQEGLTGNDITKKQGGN